MTTHFDIGYNFGKLSHQYQPVPLALPIQMNPSNCTESELLFFWQGFDKGWVESEADTVVFTKAEGILSAHLEGV